MFYEENINTKKSTMKSLSNIFEKKLIFGIGRHLWNFVSVSGYVTLLTGIILFINSTKQAFAHLYQAQFHAKAQMMQVLDK